MGDVDDLRRRRLRFLRRRRKQRRQTTMTIVEHLTELRRRLIYSLLAFVAASVVGFVFYEPLLHLIREPLCSLDPRRLGPQGCDLIITSALQGFQFRLRLAALVGLGLASPVWLYQIYAFVVPALTPKEKRYSVPFVVSAVVLFAGGAVLAYLVLPKGLAFLVAVAGEEITPFFKADEYLNFVGLMFIAFGLVFELPLVLVFLGLVGAVTSSQLRRQWRVAVVAIATLAAFATPSQDPYTMLAMSGILYALYEVTIVIVRLFERRKRRESSL